MSEGTTLSRDAVAVLEALEAAGPRGRARSGLEKAIRARAQEVLGWDIGSGAAQRKFAFVMDELRRYGQPPVARGNRRGGLTYRTQRWDS